MAAAAEGEKRRKEKELSRKERVSHRAGTQPAVVKSVPFRKLLHLSPIVW